MIDYVILPRSCLYGPTMRVYITYRTVRDPSQSCLPNHPNLLCVPNLRYWYRSASESYSPPLFPRENRCPRCCRVRAVVVSLNPLNPGEKPYFVRNLACATVLLGPAGQLVCPCDEKLSVRGFEPPTLALADRATSAVQLPSGH